MEYLCLVSRSLWQSHSKSGGGQKKGGTFGRPISLPRSTAHLWSLGSPTATNASKPVGRRHRWTFQITVGFIPFLSSFVRDHALLSQRDVVRICIKIFTRYWEITCEYVRRALHLASQQRLWKCVDASHISGNNPHIQRFLTISCLEAFSFFPLLPNVLIRFLTPRDDLSSQFCLSGIDLD
jgi:hypothetical protein